MGKGDKPVTYEEAHAPHYIAHRKGWLSLHTGELEAGDATRPREGGLSRDCQARDELVSRSVPTSNRCRSRKASSARSEQKQSRDWTGNVEMYLTGIQEVQGPH